MRIPYEPAGGNVIALTRRQRDRRRLLEAAATYLIELRDLAIGPSGHDRCFLDAYGRKLWLRLEHDNAATYQVYVVDITDRSAAPQRVGHFWTNGNEYWTLTIA